MLSAEDADEVKKLSGDRNVYATDVLAENLMGRNLRGGLRNLYTPLEAAENASMSRDLATRFIADTSARPVRRPCVTRGRVRRGDPAAVPVLRGSRISRRRSTPCGSSRAERELAVLSQGDEAAGLAILEGMRSTRPGQYEHELDAVGKFVFWRNGAQGDAYFSLIGSGHNAYWPHYNAGKRKMEDGDFLLMDYAPDVGYYESDVTRMFPVNGKFSQWQRELYGFYLACYREILKAIAPGKTEPGVHTARPEDAMDGVLSKAKFSKESHRKAAEDFVAKYKKSGESGYRYLGHWVGMATHDVGSHAGPLRGGNGLHDRAGADRAGREDLRPARGHDLHHGQGSGGRVERRALGHRRDREGDEGRGDAGEVPEGVSGAVDFLSSRGAQRRGTPFTHNCGFERGPSLRSG